MLGRRRERAALAALLDGARRARSGTLVLHGEAGIGKTMLLDDLATAATDFDVVRIDGFASERDLAYAAVHRLLTPFLDGRSRLPAVQRAALESAFGIVGGDPPNRFLVGLASLLLLTMGTARPLLCLVDDAEWLDDESTVVLGFVARRLHADRVAMVVTCCELAQVPPLEGLPALLIEGLAEGDAHRLLGAVVDRELDPALAQRVVSETRGSPLALTEMAKVLGDGRRSVDGVWSAALPLGGRLEGHFLRQIRLLPPETQALLLLAAAEPSGSSRLILAAAAAMGLGPDARDAAERAEVIVDQHGLRFRHPLVRTAVYGAASGTERRRAHQLLAEASGAAGDIDRRAWHLAAATTRADEAVAAELDDAAERALRRGGCAASAAFFTRAAELSPDRSSRVERALAAAERHLVAGFRVRSEQVLANLADDVVDPLEQARVARLEGAIRYATGEVDGTVGLLLGAAEQLAPVDLHAGRDAMLDALAAARVPGPFGATGETERDIAHAARALALPPGAPPTIADLLLDSRVALVLADHPVARQRLADAVVALDDDRRDDQTMLRWLATACWTARALGDDRTSHRLASKLEANARAHGAIVPLAEALLVLALDELESGALVAARARLAEREQLTDVLGRPSDVGRVLVLGWDGDEAATRAEAAAVRAAAEQRRHGWMLAHADHAQVVLALGLGHYTTALAFVGARTHGADVSATDVADLVEAATRSGAPQLARDALAEHEARAASSDTALARSLLARCRALVAADHDAEAHHREAVACLDGARTAQEARARLLYGEWLRRQRRPTEAREQLREAHDVFSAQGARAFATRAHRELAATGERARRRSDDGVPALTPQESQIGRLAASGATNQEIAATLFLSPSTVDYHLRKVYRKLGISSRRHLARALAP